ncbi:MAG: hypothetical protein ACK5Q5_04645 [Planctomycetaceae bacterium]
MIWIRLDLWKSLRVGLVLLSGIQLVHSQVVADDRRPPTLDSIWSRIQDKEQQLRAASVRLTGKSMRKGQAVREFTSVIHFDENRWRSDLSRPSFSRDSDPTEVVTEYACLGCLEPDEYVFWSDQRLGPDGGVSLTIYPLDAVPESERRPCVDVRRLGLTPTSVLSTGSASLDPTWKHPHDTIVTSQLESDADRPCWTLEWKVGSIRRKCWLAIEQDLSVVRLEVSRDDRIRNVVSELAATESEPRLWLPRRIVLEERIAGIITESETCDIEWLAVNSLAEPPPFSLQSFATLNLGVSVTRAAERPNADAMQFWDGTRLVTRPMDELMLNATQPLMKGSGRSLRMLFWLNAAVVCGLLAFYLLRRRPASISAVNPNDGGQAVPVGDGPTNRPNA